jgi:hypothetical protein
MFNIPKYHRIEQLIGGWRKGHWVSDFYEPSLLQCWRKNVDLASDGKNKCFKKKKREVVASDHWPAILNSLRKSLLVVSSRSLSNSLKSQRSFI